MNLFVLKNSVHSYVIYLIINLQNRIALMMQDDDVEQDPDLETISEKEIMLRLYKNDRVIREVEFISNFSHRK